MPRCRNRRVGVEVSAEKEEKGEQDARTHMRLSQNATVSIHGNSMVVTLVAARNCFSSV